jgi:hypothetical protein
MHARILTIQMRPDEIEGVVSRYREVIVPSAKTQPGFKGLMLLTDSSSGLAHSITLWDEAEQGWDQEEYRKLLGEFNNTMTVQSFARKGFEVRVRA